MKRTMADSCVGLLQGLTVLELGSVLACPAVGVFFAELGARVIKIENTKTNGDVTRSWKLPTEDKDSDISSYFSCVNWGKESLALDLSQPQGINLLYRLVTQSDMVLVNYKPGDAEKLGADYATLSKHKPNLIYGHITGYGLDSPRSGYDAIIQGESGFTYMNGEASGQGTKLPVAIMDLMAAHHLKEGLLLALLKRERTGQGEYIDVSLMQAGIASLANQAANWQVGGVIPQRMGSDHPNIVPYGTIFTTSDAKEIVLAVGSDTQFEKLCALLGQPELAQDKRFRTNLSRVKNRQLINDILSRLIAAHPRARLLDWLEREHIPAGSVNNMQEVFNTCQAQAMILRSDGSQKRSIEGLRHIAFHFHGQAAHLERLRPPPHYGEHSSSILHGLLGLDSKEIARLMTAGCIHTHPSEIG